MALDELGAAFFRRAFVDLAGSDRQLFAGARVQGQLHVTRLVEARGQGEQGVGWCADRVLADRDLAADDQVRVVSGMSVNAQVVVVDVASVAWQGAWLAEDGRACPRVAGCDHTGFGLGRFRTGVLEAGVACHYG